MDYTLYRLEGCPYCERVVDRLEAQEIEFDSVWVEGMHSNRNEVKRLSGQREVPVLVDESRGATIAESELIVDYLTAQADGANGPGGDPDSPSRD